MSIGVDIPLTVGALFFRNALFSGPLSFTMAGARPKEAGGDPQQSSRSFLFVSRLNSSTHIPWEGLHFSSRLVKGLGGYTPVHVDFAGKC